MKKLICALLSVFLITPCMANIHIRSEAVEAVIKQKISNPDTQVAALAEYNAQIKNAGGKNAGVPAAGIWSVCTAAGWDIKTADGKSKCTDFGNTLMKYATWNFRAVCDKDKFMVERGTGRCIDNVFSNKVLGGIKVNKLIANGLAKEYARVKYNDNNLVCSKNIRQTKLPPDDYVQCVSMDKNMAYEFRFDSVTATADPEIDAGTEAGVCKMFDTKYSPSGITLDTAYSKGESWSAACETTDAKICGKINESMSRFGRSAKIGTTGSRGNQRSACVINTNAVTDASKLRTAFGIDNQAFKKGGIQLNATVAVKTQVCDYVRKTVKSPTITSCVCNDGFTKLYDFSFITETDDVLTCTINGKPVDFVFDDLTESNKKVAAGGVQGMDCMAAGGTYSGQRCINLDEAQCKLLASANIKNCPICKRVKYQNGVCSLPSSADAENIRKNTNIALIVGGAVVGVGVTVMTGGAGVVVVLTGIETVGAAIELGAQLKIDAIADEFLVKSNQCKSASCARTLIKNNFQHLADSQNDFSTPEISAIDNEMARLANMIPKNDDFWAEMALSGLTMADNQSGVFENWTPEQVWRAVGITLQMASIVTSVGKWVGTKTKTMVTKLSKSSEVLKTKTENVVDVVEHATDQRVLTAKQTELQKKLGIINRDALSDIDKEYYDLWKKYAPRDQTFDDFKNMGTIEQVREWFKGWRAMDESEAPVLQIQRELQEEMHSLYDQMSEISPLPEHYDNLGRTKPEYAENEKRYLELYKRYDELHKQWLGASDAIDETNVYGNYSTYDPILAKQLKKMNVTEDSPLQDRVYAINKINELVPMGNANEVAYMRAEQIKSIIDNSEELSKIRQGFETATLEEKQRFAEQIYKEMRKANGFTPIWDEIAKVELVNDVNNSAAGSHYLGHITINTANAKENSFEGFIDTLSHEIGHAIDTANPSASAIPAQVASAAKKAYVGSDEAYDVYRATPTEQLSFKTGAVTKALNRRDISKVANFDEFIAKSKEFPSVDFKFIDESGAERYIFRDGFGEILKNVAEGKGKLKVLDWDNRLVDSFNIDEVSDVLLKDGYRLTQTEDWEFIIEAF